MPPLIPLTRLRTFTVHTRDGTAATVRDALIDDRTLQVQRLALTSEDPAHWQTANVEPAFLRVDPGGERLVVDVDDRTLADEPDSASEPSVRTSDGQTVGGWPAPRRNRAVAPRRLGDDVHQPHPRQRSAKRLKHGTLVDEAGRRFGSVRDVLIDVEQWRVIGLIVRTRRHLPSPSVFAPAGEIRGIDWQADEVLVTGYRDRFLEACDAAPAPDDPDER